METVWQVAVEATLAFLLGVFVGLLVCRRYRITISRRNGRESAP